MLQEAPSISFTPSLSLPHLLHLHSPSYLPDFRLPHPRPHPRHFLHSLSPQIRPTHSLDHSYSTFIYPTLFFSNHHTLFMLSLLNSSAQAIPLTIFFTFPSITFLLTPIYFNHFLY